MGLLLPIADPVHVLITHPGPRVAEVVHGLLDQGATIDVAVEGEPSATLADLRARHLVTLVAPPADSAAYARYDLVLRDPLGAAPSLVTRSMTAAPPIGRVILVGGGPGDPGLLTVAGLEAIRSAQVIVCDRLAPLGVLASAAPEAEVIHVGKIPRGAFTPQEAINAVLVEKALAGSTVVRLKGGDSFVFGRGGEEWNACVRAGVPVEVLPGVTSAVSVPALAGIPLTHRQTSPGFVVVSGHVGPSHPSNAVDWEVLARCGLTLVLLMGIAALPEITTALIDAGLDPATPAACVADGAMPSQRDVRATLDTIAVTALEAGLAPPAITIIGPVVDALLPT